MIQEVAQIVTERANERINNGLYNRLVSLDGYAALMLDKLQRWFKTRNEEELEELAIDGFFVLLKSIEKSEG